MVPAVSDFLREIERVRRVLGSGYSRQIHAVGAGEHLRQLAEAYFNHVRSDLEHVHGIDGEISDADLIFRELLALSRKRSSRDKCLRLVKKAKETFIALEGSALSNIAAKASGAITSTDREIIESLTDLCPTAAQSYRQAMLDLESKERLSYRGPATDLREALRETLDILAPDEDVEATQGYRLEQDAKRPTMKQKARYILKNRGLGSGQLQTSDNALQGIEEIVGGLVRSVYTRSSVSTHVGSGRTEVVRIHAWVRLILCELLEIPL